MGVIGIRVNICSSSCGFSVNLCLGTMVDSMEQTIQGADKGMSLKLNVEG